jgi:23S rRNA pseudouridine2605 synthase/16S rRNA pseudouridine516 synthase
MMGLDLSTALRHRRVMAKRDTPKWLEAARSAGEAGRDWIGRALPRAGVLAPAAAEKAIFSGRVTIDGVVVRDPFAPVEVTQRVAVDGEPVSLAAATKVLVLHKPAGIVVAAEDRQGTVFEALQRTLPPDLTNYGWHAVGRLDRETTGLLLFSNDERFVAHVTSPESHLTKTYVATTDGAVKEAHVAALLAGVTIEDGPAKAVSVKKRGKHELEVVIDEGRHHQVRQMLNAVRLAIRALHREAIGALVLDVPGGEQRALREDEITSALGYVPRATEPPGA